MVVVGALVDLAELISAFGAYLIVGVLLVWVLGVVAAIVGGLPVVGDSVAGAIRDFASSLQRNAQGMLDNQVRSITDIIDFVSGMAQSWADAVAGTLDWITGLATDLIDRLIFSTQALFRDVGKLWDRAHALADEVSRAFDRLVAQAAHVAWVVANVIPRAIEQAAAALTALMTGRLADAVRALRSLVATASAGAAAAVGAEAAARRGADAALRAGVLSEVAALGTAIDGELTDLGRELGRAIDGVAKGLQDIVEGVGPLALPAIAAAISAIGIEIATMRRVCVDPTCGYLGPQLASLNAIGDIITLTAVAELVSFAARDPRAAALRSVGEFGPVAGSAREMLGALTGVHV